MDILDEEILGLWKSFAKYKLQYILVGGFATNLNGFARTTADMDIWILDNPDNRKRLRLALEGIGLGDMQAVEGMEFVPGWTSISLLSGYQLDVMTHMKGLPQVLFEECYKSSPQAEIHGIVIRFLHINHLIEAKKASGRSKDLIDVEELEKIRNPK